jgi:CO/xanthine dehydrogenase Mo-binding subunit
VIIERTYQTQRQAHAFLEPEAGVAAVDETGRLTVWFPTQCTHMARATLAKLMAMPLRKVRVVQTVCGGAFGGKALFSIEPFLALLSFRTGRPVKIVQTRAESMAYSYKRVPFVIKHRIGAREDGRLVAAEIEILADAGAYLGYETPLIVQRAAVHACGPYEVPNVSVDAYYVYTNNVMSGPVRGFGVPQVAFALELQLDLLARQLGLDPLQIRLINAMMPGSVTATGQKLEASVGFKETLLRAGRLAGWESPSTI